MRCWGPGECPGPTPAKRRGPVGSGPNGSGVTISKPDPNAQRETLQQRESRARQERAERMRQHAESEAAFQAKQQPPHEDKALRPRRQTKARPTETAEDLAALSMNAIQALAEERGIIVTNPDGDEPTRDDYVRTLAR